MTYAQLAAAILRFDNEQLHSDITLYSTDDEFFPCELRFATEDNDVLDLKHPYFGPVGYPSS